MKKAMSLVICSLVLSIGVPPVTFAAAVAAITGTVTNTNNRPVSGATITAKDANGKVIGTAVSDAQGNYSMSIPVGTSYALEIAPPSLYSQKSPTTVPQGILGPQGVAVNWVVSFETAALWFVLGGVALTAGAVGGGLQAGGSTKKKKMVTGTQ